MKQVSALLLILAMCFSFFCVSCEDEKRTEQPTDYTYRVILKAQSTVKCDSVLSTSLQNNEPVIFTIAEKAGEVKFGVVTDFYSDTPLYGTIINASDSKRKQVEIPRRCLTIYSQSGGETETVYLKKNIGGEWVDEDFLTISGVASMPDGGFVALLDNDTANSRMRIARWDRDGKRVFMIDAKSISALITDKTQFVVSKEGNVCFLTSKFISVMTGSGEFAYNAIFPEKVLPALRNPNDAKLLLDPDGIVLLAYESGGKYHCCPLDEDYKELGGEFSFPSTDNNAPLFAAGYEVCYADSTGFLGAEKGNSKPKLLFDWPGLGLYFGLVKKIEALPDGNFLVVTRIFSTAVSAEHYFLGIISRNNPFDANRPQYLTKDDGYDSADIKIAYVFDNSSLSDYNKVVDLAEKYAGINNCSVKISLYAADSDITADEKLRLDITAGYIPDVVFSKSDSISDSIETVDLYKLIDTDAAYSRDDFVSCVLKPFEHEGKLPSLAMTYSIGTILARESVLGDRKIRTLEQLAEFAQSLPSETALMAVRTEADDKMLANQLANYCSGYTFDTLLSFAGSIEKKLLRTESIYTELTLFTENKAAVCLSQFMNNYNFMFDRYAFFPDGDAVIAGCPNASGEFAVAAITPNLQFLIPAQSENSAAAWELAKYCFSENEYSHSISARYSCLKSSIEAQIAEAKKYAYAIVTSEYTDANGTPKTNYLLYYDKIENNRVYDSALRYFTFSAEDEAALRSLFSGNAIVCKRES